MCLVNSKGEFITTRCRTAENSSNSGLDHALPKRAAEVVVKKKVLLGAQEAAVGDPLTLISHLVLSSLLYNIT